MVRRYGNYSRLTSEKNTSSFPTHLLAKRRTRTRLKKNNIQNGEKNSFITQLSEVRISIKRINMADSGKMPNVVNNNFFTQGIL